MYKFTLETVLNHRKTVEETLQKELAESRQLLLHEEQRLWNYKKIKKRSLREFRKKQRGRISISENMLYANFLASLSKDLERQKERVMAVEKEIDRKVASLVQALKERKKLENLKDKEMMAYRKEWMRSEQHLLDEMAVHRFNRGV